MRRRVKVLFAKIVWEEGVGFTAAILLTPRKIAIPFSTSSKNKTFCPFLLMLRFAYLPCPLLLRCACEFFVGLSPITHRRSGESVAPRN